LWIPPGAYLVGIWLQNGSQKGPQRPPKAPKGPQSPPKAHRPNVVVAVVDVVVVADQDQDKKGLAGLFVCSGRKRLAPGSRVGI
jgi:hypothetical protein